MTHLRNSDFAGEVPCSYRELVVPTIVEELNSKNNLGKCQENYLLPADISSREVGMAFTKITALRKGVVSLGDQLWIALSNNDMAISPGQKVRVLGIQGHTLLVESVS